MTLERTSWKSVLVLYFYLRLGFPCSLFPSGFPTENLYAALLSAIHVTCPVHLILFYLVTRILLGKGYWTLSSSISSLLHSSVTSSLLSPTTYLITQFSNNLSLYSPTVWQTKCPPTQNNGTFTFLYERAKSLQIFWYCMYRASYDEWVCRSNFTCTKCILHILTILQHVSAHHTCHHQGVFVVVISIDSEVKTSKPTALWQYQLSKLCRFWGSNKDAPEDSNWCCLVQGKRPALGPTEARTEWETVVLLPLRSSRGLQLTAHMHRVPSLEIHGSISTLPYTPSWRARGQIYLSSAVKIILFSCSRSTQRFPLHIWH